MNKGPFAVIGSNRDEATVTCEADFWEGPTDPGRKGKYVRHRFIEQWVHRHEYEGQDGARRVVLGHPLSTSPSVSYYPKLMSAFAKIGCRP